MWFSTLYVKLKKIRRALYCNVIYYFTNNDTFRFYFLILNMHLY